jgi:hypothetical protein
VDITVGKKDGMELDRKGRFFGDSEIVGEDVKGRKLGWLLGCRVGFTYGCLLGYRNG